MYLVFNEVDLSSVDIITDTCRLDGHSAIGGDVTREIQFAQVSPQPQVSAAPQVHITQETGGKRAQELSTRVVELHAKFDIMMLRGDIASYDGVRRNDSLTFPDHVIGHSVNINLSLTKFPSHIGIECAETALYQLEVVDTQTAIDIRTVKDSFHAHRTRNRTTELHRVEVDKVEDIAHIDIGERCRQRITVTVSACPRDKDTLRATGDKEVVDLQMVLAVKYGRRMDRIERVTDMNLRLIEVKQSQSPAFHILPESNV